MVRGMTHKRLVLVSVAALFAQAHYGAWHTDGVSPYAVLPLLSAVAAGMAITAAVHLTHPWWVAARLASLAAISWHLLVAVIIEARPCDGYGQHPGEVFLAVAIDGLTLLGLWAVFALVQPGGGRET